MQRFSTNDIPVSMRREVAEAVYSEHVSGALDFVPGQIFDADLRMRPVADVRLAMYDISPARFFTPAEDDGLLRLGFTLRGGGRIIEAGRDAQIVEANSVCVMPSELGYHRYAELPTQVLNIVIPYEMLEPRLASYGLSTMQMLPTSIPAALLLQGYAMTLLAQDGSLSPQEEELFARHIADLTGLLLGPSRDGAELARQGGGRAARWQMIQADIHANLGNPALSLEWLARRQGLSPSYTRTLFYGEGTSFTDFVAMARLDAVAMRLRDPANAHRTITALAMETGFGDISWFNQLFRRRFGMTPSEMRAGEG